MTLFENLFKNGQLPTLETSVTVEKNTIYTTASVLFITAFLIFLTWYTFKKLA